jgi:hypothetical protein
MFKGTFVFESKKVSASENQKKHKATTAAENGNMLREPGRSTLHVDQNTDWLPASIRGGFYIHNLHFNCVLGMSGGTDTGIKELIKSPEKYFCPFTCLTKGSKKDIEAIIKAEDYLVKTKYSSTKRTVDYLLDLEEKGSKFLYGNSEDDGFPINFILQAVAYVIAAEAGQVNGKRVRGEYHQLLHDNKRKIIEINIPDKGTCLKIHCGDFAALIGYVNDKFNKTLIKKIEGAKIFMQEPVFEECIQL